MQNHIHLNWLKTLAIFALFALLLGCSLPPAITVTSELSQPQKNTQPASTQILPSSTITPTPTYKPSVTSTLLPQPQPGSDSIGDPYAPEMGNPGYDVLSYSLQLVLDPVNTHLSGNARINARIDAPAINRLSLDFAGYEITSLFVNQLDAAYERENAKLWITLPEPAYQDDNLIIDISYAGSPLIEPSPYVPFISHVGLYYPGSTIFSLSEPDGAHYWFPSNDHPRDKATLEVSITVPDKYTGISNGSLIGTEPAEAGWTIYHWEHPYPTAPYLAVVAVGDYQRIDRQSPGGVPLRHYVYPDLLDEFNSATMDVGEALDWMADTFGPYPFESFGFVTSRLVGLASETQTMVVLPETGLNEETVIHELAHMWFGNWVSLDSWADMWLKEGLAIYTYLLWQTRNQPGDLEYFMQERTNRLLAGSTGYPLNNLPKSQLLGTDTYWKGAAVIHALRKEVGNDHFFKGLQLLLERYGGKNISLAEFQEVMEEVSGKSLSSFFDLWLSIN